MDVTLEFEEPKISNGWEYSQAKIGGCEMQNVREININEAAIHVLDNSGDEPVLNEYKLSLNDDVYKFILKHVERCLKDDELKYAAFNDERNIVKEVSQEYLNGQNDIVNVSKELARQLFILMKGNENISSCDLMVVSISTEYGPMLGILKMDYIKNYIHVVDFVEDKIDINIIQQASILPSSSSKITKCAFIKPIREDQEFNLMVIDKQKKSRSKSKEEYGTNYFINKYLGCKIVENERDCTKKFIKATDEWVKKNLENNAEAAEKVIRTVNRKLKDSNSIDVKELSENMFLDESVKEDYKQYIEEQGVREKVNLDKDWIEKKFKRIRLKIDNNMDLYIDEEAYNNSSKFNVRRIGDGTVDITIKNVRNYILK